MTKQLILYAGHYRYSHILATQTPFVVAKSGLADLEIPHLRVDKLVFRLTEDQVEVTIDGETQLLSDYSENVAGLKVYVTDLSERSIYDLLTIKHVSVGVSTANTLVLEGIKQDPGLVLVQEGGTWSVVASSTSIYLNNKRVIVLPHTLRFGDEISFAGLVLKHFGQELWVSGAASRSSQLVEKTTSLYHFYEGYPDYHRSPRIIYREPEDKVTIKGPTEPPRKPTNQLLRAIVPPLVMVGMVVLLSFIQPRGIYIYIMIVTSIVTVIFSVSNYFKNRREYKENLVEREVLFREYLMDKSQDLYQLAEKQRQGQLYHYPTVAELADMASRYDHRIYEKTPLQFDFLSFRLGLGERKASFQLSYPPLDKEKKLDDLEKEGLALYDTYRKTNQLPIVSNLMLGPVGVIGPRHLVIEQLQLLVNQLAFFHSYYDVQLITLVPEEEKELWHWMRWLPHAKLQDINVRGLVYNQRSRDQVLNSLYQILKIRKSERNNKEVKESTRFTPHYVVIVTDPSFILDHVIMEFLNGDPTELGCSLIFVQDTISSLSENITTIIDIKDRNDGVLVLEQGELVNKTFRLDHFGVDFDKELLPRLLAPLNHLRNLQNSIPESVGFLEMYGVKEVGEINIPALWASHAPHQSLSVPLGMRGKDDLVYLDLHERAHGPHGLVAGTTGAGKSEILQSYILSLALNFHPYDVAFLLIDYKGGGMANLFKDLPHLLGTITNLDAASSMRALVSIQAELKRRQRLFSEHEVNHINQYQKLYKEGKARVPMPHLFLISDEFAELKSNEPEFMKELVSTSRIGRSLGIHLILATQKPTGVVDDQIWSNSRFKLALKVATTQDSQEMLKTADAADITQAGRAYLQVGNNEIYELFQSAYSGADYQPDKDKLHIEDHTIYAINDNGQYDIKTQDLSGLDEAEAITQIPTELDVIVDTLQQTSAFLKVEALPRPWLPPLEMKILLSDLTETDYQKLWANSPQELSFTVGMADIPEEQNQKVVHINLTRDSNVLLYGAPGYGKTTFLQSTVMDLARHYDPDRVHFYLLDFGTNGLASLANLPHTADIIRLEQTEKVEKFTRVMAKEINRRKQLLSEHGVGTLEIYQQVSGKREAEIVVVIDSFEPIKDESFEEVLFKLLQRVSREGLSVGIRLIITAGRQSNLRATLYSNFKHQLTLRQNDKGEVRNVVGPTPLADIPDIQGRGLVKRDEVHSTQFVLPIEAKNPGELIECLSEEVSAMNSFWQGKRPSNIPMVPEELTIKNFTSGEKTSELLGVKTVVPIGLDVEEVLPQVWDLSSGNILYIYEQEKHRTRMLTNIVQLSIVQKFESTVFSTTQQGHTDGTKVLHKASLRKNHIVELHNIIEESIDLEEKLDQPMILIWDNLVELIQEDTSILDRILFILKNGQKVGYYSFIMSTPLLSSTSNVVTAFVKQMKYAIIETRLNDQKILTIPNVRYSEPPLKDSIVYMLNNKNHIKLKIPNS